MTATGAVMEWGPDGVLEVHIPEPLPHQTDIDDSPAKRKVGRCGRRWGKTRWAFKASMAGHGPLDVDGTPMHEGVLQGWDVVWVALDYGQADTLWNEEIVPRFKGVPGFYVNETKKCVHVSGLGRLHIKSAENIHTIRGVGKRLKGVILDEGAHYDLETALRAVVLPALLDNDGWLAILSTTKAGSYFNAVCTEIQEGKRSDEWAEFYGTPHDNPKLSPAAIAELEAEYKTGDGSTEKPELHEEVYAKLLTGGAGLAFPEWNAAVHVLPETAQVPRFWRWCAGLDWGYADPGCFVLVAAGESGQIIGRMDYRFSGTDPYEVGYTIGQLVVGYGLPEWIAGDSSMWDVTDGGPTIAERVQKGLNDALQGATVPLVSTPKGPGSRVAGKLLIHEGLKYTRAADGTVPSWGLPLLRFHPDARYLVSSLPKLPRDEKKTEDVDTKADDHAYDALRYCVMLRTPQAEAPRRDVPEHQHPGFVTPGVRRARERTPENEAHEQYLELAARGALPTSRYGRRPGL